VDRSAAGASRVSATAAAIAAIPGLAARLLSEHADDGSGRCRRCSMAGQAGRERWPCRIHTYAAAAAPLDR
jgi:hypothetical protein